MNKEKLTTCCFNVSMHGETKEKLKIIKENTGVKISYLIDMLVDDLYKELGFK